MPNAFADLPPVPTAKGNAFADLPPVSTAKGNAFADLPPATPVAAAKSTTPQQPMGWGETVKQAVRNIPSSAMAQVEGLVDMARHPIRTADSAAGTIAGAAYAAGLPKPGGAYRAEAEADERKARQFAQFYKDRYGSVEGFKRSLAKDPVGVGLDAATLASAGAGAARLVRGGAKAATLGEVASDAATAGAERKPGLVRQAYQKTRAAFDPSRASEQARASALFIRKAKGLQGAQADRIGYQLGKLSGRMERSTPEQINGFYKFVENRSKAPETGKPGVVLGADKLGPRGTVTGNEYEFAKDLGLGPHDLKAADAIRDAYQHWHAEASKIVPRNTGGTIGFIKDYYTHMWADDPAEVERRMAAFSTKQGTGRYFKTRTIPTIEDGLKAGLTPKYGPLQTVQVYSENMANLMATHEAQAFLKQNGYASWHRPGQQPEGWVPLNGILAERLPKGSRGARGGPPPDVTPAVGPKALPGPEAPQLGGPGGQRALPGAEPPIVEAPKELPGRNAVGRARWPGEPVGLGAEARPALEDAAASARNVTPGPEAPKAPKTNPDRAVQKEVLYARPEVARIYNNSISKPFDPSAGPGEALGHYAYKAGVNAMLWKFALSAYHASTMLFESAASRMGAGWESASRGNIAKGLGKIASAPLAPLKYGLEGDMMKRQILGKSEFSPFRKDLAERFSKAGGRVTMDRDYRGTQAKTFYDAWKTKSLAPEIKRQAQAMFGSDIRARDRAVAAGRAVSNLMSSAVQPLFEEIIPRLKMGAWSDMMEGYLRERPGATEREIEEYAARALDSIDNRFGEMNRDNMFWKRKTQQVLSAALMSPTWKIGSWREIGGGLHDIPEGLRGIKSGAGISPRTAYVLSLATLVPLTNAIFTYLKTGQPPQDAADLAAYRTGGKDPRTGGPERALFPGNQKEVYAMANALQSGPPGLLAYATNGANSVPAALSQLVQNKDYAGRPIYGTTAARGALGDWAREQAMPISVEIQKERLKGSNIGSVEAMLGARTAPAYLSGVSSARYQHYQQAAQRMNERARARKKAMYEQ